MHPNDIYTCVCWDNHTCRHWIIDFDMEWIYWNWLTSDNVHPTSRPNYHSLILCTRLQGQTTTPWKCTPYFKVKLPLPDNVHCTPYFKVKLPLPDNVHPTSRPNLHSLLQLLPMLVIVTTLGQNCLYPAITDTNTVVMANENLC